MLWPICLSFEIARFRASSHRQFLTELRHPYIILRERLPLENLTFFLPCESASESKKASFSGKAFNAAVAYGLGQACGPFRNT